MNNGLSQIVNCERTVKQLSAEEVSRRNFELKRKLALEAREIIEHKYYLGEKKGQEVSIDDATMDFSETLYNGENYAARFERNYLANKAEIYDACDKHCSQNVCKGVGKCDLPMEYVHLLLRD